MGMEQFLGTDGDGDKYRLPPRTTARTVSSELLGFCFYFFVSGPCARLSWLSGQLLRAC